MTKINSGVAPNITERLGSVLRSPHEFDADYGSRIMGWLVPPTSGDYIFWIAAENPGAGSAARTAAGDHRGPAPARRRGDLGRRHGRDR